MVNRGEPLIHDYEIYCQLPQYILDASFKYLKDTFYESVSELYEAYLSDQKLILQVNACELWKCL